MRLSLELGVSVGELRATLPAAEFSHYRTYFAHEPSVGERIDWWGGQILAALLNPYRPAGKGPYRPESLTPNRWPVSLPEVDDVTAQVVAWGQMMAAMGG